MQTAQTEAAEFPKPWAMVRVRTKHCLRVLPASLLALPMAAIKIGNAEIPPSSSLQGRAMHQTCSRMPSFPDTTPLHGASSFELDSHLASSRLRGSEDGFFSLDRLADSLATVVDADSCALSAKRSTLRATFSKPPFSPRGRPWLVAGESFVYTNAQECY